MARIILRVLNWAAGRIPTLFVWAGLIGLFVYGAGNGWKFGEAPPEKAKVEKEKPEGEPGGFEPYFLPQAFDVPVQVAHDPKKCGIGAKPIRFKSPQSAALAGIGTVQAERRPVAVAIEAHGELQQDATATAKVSPRVGGVLVAVEKQLGDPVRRGELLALVESAEVGKDKAAYLVARAALESREAERAILMPGVTPSASIVKADAAVREARANLFSARQAIANLGLPLLPTDEEKLPDEAFARRLLLLGVPFGKRLELYARMDRDGAPPPANLLPIFSPLDGVVVKRVGVVGETIAALQPLFEVGDPTRIYAYLDVRQEDMAKLAIGQAMTFKLEGGANLPTTAGAIDWISPTVDAKTRTVRVRSKLPNAGGVLRGGAFGEGTITVEPVRPALMVPREAVHWEGCSHLVFVKKQDGAETVYWPRKVTLGVRDAGGVEIAAGLEAGDAIAVVGSHVLKIELLKARIGDAEE